MEMAKAIPVMRNADDGERLAWAGGGVITVKATAAETAGAFLLFDFDGERGKTTPLHIHPGEDEGMYVLEGEIRVHVAGEEASLGTGGTFICLRGVPHAFMVTSESARLLSWQTPGTGETFYREASDPAPAGVSASHPPDWARLRDVASRSPSIEIVGPSPFENLDANGAG